MDIKEDYLDWIGCQMKKNNEMVETILGILTERDSNVLVSCCEAARLLGVTPTAISMMIRQHRLKKIRLDRSTGIRLSEIRDMLNSQ